jgi:hypothetical protein
MKGVARISFPNGVLLLPAKTPYERETVFEHADQFARRYGHAELQLGRSELLVALCTDSPALRCSVCRQELDRLVYTLKSRALCAHCARLKTR